MEQQYDLIVVGGGPGGSTVSTLVAAKGHKVLLLERETFPRHQIGESLLPSTIQVICPLLGVKEEIDKASFTPKKGGTFLWGKSKELWSFHFDVHAEPGKAKDLAYQVERSKFDQILLDNAKKNGVEVKHHCVVTEVIEENNRVVGVKYQDSSGNMKTAYSRFVADASGHNSKIYQTVGERVNSKHFDNVAIYGYFENGKRLPSPNEGSILVVAFDHGWLWYIPLSEKLTSVGIVIAKNQESNVHSRKEEIFNKYVFSARLMDHYLGDAKRCSDDMYGKLRVRLDYSYASTELWKPGMVLIGDAGCFIDPVFSSGVHLSTFSGLLAARSINSTIADPANEAKYFHEFEKRYRKEFANFYNYLMAFYDMEQYEETYFWTAKRIMNSPEKSNVAFVKLISGFSTDSLDPRDSTENYFEERKNFREGITNMLDFLSIKHGDASLDSLKAKNFTQPPPQVDELFMKVANKLEESVSKLDEVIARPEKGRVKKGSLMPSEDLLCWEES